ncbi:MAG: hypothetical protein K6F33_15540 [Bacteroidales bacterium]|nr:hypothetical protein [Bacteroidales bacterium]
MALTAKLQFGDNGSKIFPTNQTYMVVDCRCHFTRSYNQFHPESDARCERLELTVDPKDASNHTFHEWYITQSAQSGSIVFDITNTSAGGSTTSQMTVLFEDAYCFSIAEEYNIDNSSNKCMRLSIVAEKIKVCEVEFTNLYK